MRPLLHALLLLAGLAACSKSSLPQYFLENAAKAMQDGRREDAHRYLDRGLKLSPNNVELLDLQGWLYYQHNEYEKAAASFSRAATAAPGESAHLEGRVWSELCLGRFKEASELSKLSFQTLDWYGEEALWSCLAAYLSYRSLGQEAEAQSVLEAAQIHSRWSDWPQPIFEHLRGRLSRADLLKKTTALSQETEARAYLGFEALFAGKKEEALHEFKWIEEKGSEEVFERNLAIAQSKRITP